MERHILVSVVMLGGGEEMALNTILITISHTTTGTLKYLSLVFICQSLSQYIEKDIYISIAILHKYT